LKRKIVVEMKRCNERAKRLSKRVKK